MKVASDGSANDKFTGKRAKKPGLKRREYIVHDWALIFQANACHLSKTAEALDVSRWTLDRYLKADEELQAAFDDIKLSERDDVRSELVKLALSGHFHAIRFYLESHGGFGYAVAETDEDEDDSVRTEILHNMTLQEKAEAYAKILEENNRKITEGSKRPRG